MACSPLPQAVTWRSPARAPNRVGDDEVRAFSEQQRPELAAYQFGESLVMGTRNLRRAGCQAAASSEMPPSGRRNRSEFHGEDESAPAPSAALVPTLL
jgi:hypothetical protein